MKKSFINDFYENLKKSRIIFILKLLIIFLFIIGLIIKPLAAIKLIFILIALICLAFPIAAAFYIYKEDRINISNKILLPVLILFILFFGLIFANIGTTGIPFLIKYTAPIICPAGFDGIKSEPYARQYDLPGLVFTLSRKIICFGELGEYEPARAFFILSGMILYFIYCSIYFFTAFALCKIKYLRKRHCLAQILCLLIFIPLLFTTVLNRSFLLFVSKPVNRILYYGHAESMVESVRRHNIIMIQKLLTAGGNIYALNDKNESALTLAQRLNDREILKIFGELIAKGSNAKTKLFEKGIVYSKKNYFNCVVKNDIEAVKLFLSAGMDINTISDGEEFNNTALSIAAGKGYLEMAEFLLEKKADINKRGDAGFTPLQAAAINSQTDMVLLLIKNKADIEAKTKNKNSALMMASRASNIEIIKTLIENKASINIKTDIGYTALLFAIEHTVNADKRYEIVKYLLDKGADPNVNIYTGTYEGMTPLKLERMRNDLRIIKLLEERHARE